MLLSIRDLKVAFRLGERGAVSLVPAVSGVSFDIPEHTTVALVGESGSGKSVTAMSILNLLPDNARRSGVIEYEGRGSAQGLAAAELQALRGKEIACVFQDPMTSLNPVFSVGRQLAEPLQRHLKLSRREAIDRAEALMIEVGIPESKRRLASYPHELSGGQQQRVMIAMALACEPKLLIADEPTTALDVTIQRQILELIAKLQERHRMSVLFISHDLGLVGEIADHVVVMRQGVVREQGAVARIFLSPHDAYTKALLACRPSLANTNARLPVIDDHIEGTVPNRQAKPKRSQRAGAAAGAIARQELFPARRAVRQARVQGGARRQLRSAPRSHAGCGRRESGSGKTTMGLTLLRLHEPTGGEVLFDGRNLLTLSDYGAPGNAPTHPDRVPEPVRLAEPALHDRPDVDRADDHPWHRREPR